MNKNENIREININTLMTTRDFAVGKGTIVILEDGYKIKVETNEYLKSLIDEMKYSYTKTESDLLFPKKENVYNKIESDELFCNKPNFNNSANGYWQCSNSGFTIQWGNAQLNNVGTTIIFPIPFKLIICSINANSTSVYGTQYPLVIPKDNIQLNQCLIKGAPWIAEMNTFNWIAVGF